MKDLYEPLHEFFSIQQRFTFPYDKKEIRRLTDSNGLYILFEKGEIFNGLERIVRIGSHDSSHRLVKRLKNHFLSFKQRNSIFRKHIGRCFLAMENDEYIENWNLPFKKKIDVQKNKNYVDLEYEKKYEILISNYISKNLSFTLIPRVYERGKVDKIEKGLIASLAQSSKKISSDMWLGNFHPDPKIKKAKLWNI